MTFDARGGKRPAISSNAIFACAVVAVVSGAFLAVLNFPAASHKDHGHLETVDMADTDLLSAPSGLTSKPATYYFETLARIDPSASEDLKGQLNKHGDRTGIDKSNIVLEHGAALLRERAADLARTDTKHIDDLLVLTRDRLKAASRASNIWCDGEQYADMNESSLRDPAALRQKLAQLETPLRNYGYELMAHLLLAADDAARTPVNHGPITHTDKAALEGVAMSMMTDPQIMPLIMAAGTSAHPDDLRRQLNVCELGATAMTALKTLPDDTKGRVFADLVRQLATGNASLATLR
ncbi:MAG: hypothetical protein KKB75_17255 [Alphaproteobacteria bacterium]|nr:hypothetical protein [Alphaproteobacteria bacterium]MBU2141954.1 hypothetical protein [Alphaproteobacteria bacterium]MBU2198434.1 hypothetical protein [Alphaproteobacteria bacterium]